MAELKLELPKEKIEEAVNDVLNKVRSDTGMTLKECYEKQIPKKPVEMKPTDKLLNGYYACPICGGWVGMNEYSNNYCVCCGQKIDWSE